MMRTRHQRCIATMAALIIVVGAVRWERSQANTQASRAVVRSAISEFDGATVTMYSEHTRSLWGAFIDSKRYGDDELSALASVGTHLETVEYLSLAGSNVSDAGCKYLTSMPNLYHLDLSHTRVSSFGVRQLSELRHLASLRLTGTNVDDNIIPLLQSLPALERVDVRDTQITHEGLERLSSQNTSLELSFVR